MIQGNVKYCDSCDAKNDNPFSPIKIQANTWNTLEADRVPDVPWLEKRDYHFCSSECCNTWVKKQSDRWDQEKNQETATSAG